jgi:hypothetical protein
MPSKRDDQAININARNRFDRMEWAGAFGDLGTLIPFVVAYIAVLKVDPFGILFSFGAAMVIYSAGVVTGVIWLLLGLTGAQLALGSCDFSKNKGERFIAVATAAFAMWNVGLSFIVGITLAFIAKRGLLRL